MKYLSEILMENMYFRGKSTQYWERISFWCLLYVHEYNWKQDNIVWGGNSFVSYVYENEIFTLLGFF